MLFPSHRTEARLITPSVVSERLKVNGSVARQAIRHLEESRRERPKDLEMFFFEVLFLLGGFPVFLRNFPNFKLFCDVLMFGAVNSFCEVF